MCTGNGFSQVHQSGVGSFDASAMARPSFLKLEAGSRESW